MLLGLTGFKGSGKNTVADYLTEKYNFEQLSFATKVKKSAAACFGIDPEIWEKLKNNPAAMIRIETSSFPGSRDIIIESRITAREFLQHYGVEAHRDIFGDDFWVDQVLPDENYPNRGWYDRNAVITDVRFENEVIRVRKNGGAIINIQRDSTQAEDHASEQAIDSKYIKHTIQNNGSIEDLHKSVDEFLISVLLNASS